MASVTQETRGGEGRGLFVRGMRLVVAYVRMHPRPFLVSVAGSLVFAVSSVLLTTALGRATDQVLKPGSDARWASCSAGTTAGSRGSA